jgi:hypothetical protein
MNRAKKHWSPSLSPYPWGGQRALPISARSPKRSPTSPTHTSQDKPIPLHIASSRKRKQPPRHHTTTGNGTGWEKGVAGVRASNTGTHYQTTAGHHRCAIDTSLASGRLRKVLGGTIAFSRGGKGNSVGRKSQRMTTSHTNLSDNFPGTTVAQLLSRFRPEAMRQWRGDSQWPYRRNHHLKALGYPHC